MAESYESKLPRFDIDNKYIAECEKVYGILTEIYVVPFCAKIIAEFAATQYLPCIDCNEYFGFNWSSSE